MSIDQRIPDLSDKELDTLHANAVRLAESGSVQQRQQAEGLLPLIGAELETRSQTKAAIAAAKPKRVAKKRAAPAESAPKDDADAE
ncbi:MAG TPA: hypothetical protein VM915_07930 [Verrucomicrobiae bacterium]|nr:hypothetical protein [Verrucomicrobiae bacterium]